MIYPHNAYQHVCITNITQLIQEEQTKAEVNILCAVLVYNIYDHYLKKHICAYL